jgi:hypothetical protein
MSASWPDAAEGGTASCKFLYDAVVRCRLRRCEIRHDQQSRAADNAHRIPVDRIRVRADVRGGTSALDSKKHSNAEASCETGSHCNGSPRSGGATSIGWQRQSRSAPSRISTFARPPRGAAMVQKDHGAARQSSLLNESELAVR